MHPLTIHTKRYVVIAFMALFATVLKAQDDADSLRTLLETCESDSVCMRLNIELCDLVLFSDPLAASTHCEDALVLGTALQDTAALAKTQNLIGILATIRGHYLTGVERFQEALTYYEHLGDREGVAKILNNIGVIYSSLENYPEAIRYYKECCDLNYALDDIEGASFNLFNIASDYLMLKQYDNAEQFIDSLQTLHNEFPEALNPDPLKGELYLARDQLDLAEPFLIKSIGIHKRLGEEHQLATGYLSLAQLYSKKDRLALANAYLDSALTVSERNELTDTEIAVYELRAEVLQQAGLFKRAYEKQSRYVALKDSLDEINNFNRISELNARFESEKREKELAEQKAMMTAQKASQRFQERVFILITAFIVIVLSIVTWSLIRKRRINRLLNSQNKEIEEQRQKIIASINYAKKIQNSILLPEEEIRKFLPNAFVYFRPKDIVSGDFYWFTRVENGVMLATIDCTGHGVPGAFMSLIANSKLNKVVNELRFRDPGEILNKVHEEILESLNQHNGVSQTQDGMDMSLCLIKPDENILEFAGARNPIVLINGGEVTELKPDSLSIGGSFFRDKHAKSNGFSTQKVNYDSGTYLYLFTDGYIDQFGGPDNKKLNKRRFHNLISGISHNGFDHVKGELDERFEKWRGNNPQIDDILIIGTRL